MNDKDNNDLFPDDHRPYIVAWEEMCGPKHGRFTDNPTTKPKAEAIAHDLNDFKPSIRHWAEPL